MIELVRVHKQYSKKQPVLEDISLSFPPGSLTCLVGPSGCGKTTLLKLINRLIEPTAGNVLVEGKSVQEWNPFSLRRSIGYIVQGGGMLPHLSVLGNIALPGKIQGLSQTEQEKRALEVLELVGLPAIDFAKRFPRELSGGQIQRVSLARALMTDPPILLMDEPFGALDPITRNTLQDTLLELQAQYQKTIILVTHDLPEAFKLGDLIVLLQFGHIVQQGQARAFLTQPANEFVAQFVNAQKGIQLNDI